MAKSRQEKSMDRQGGRNEWRHLKAIWAVWCFLLISRVDKPRLLLAAEAELSLHLRRTAQQAKFSRVSKQWASCLVHPQHTISQ